MGFRLYTILSKGENMSKPRKNYSKGRGKFEDPIELKYVQISRESLNELFRCLNSIPENSRMLALWHFVYNFLTNEGFESLRLKDAAAYILCSQMNEKHFVVQNEARWNMWDNFYKHENITFEEAFERERQRAKANKSEQNKRAYQERKKRDIVKEQQEIQDALKNELLKKFFKEE